MSKFGFNGGYIDELYAQFLSNPQSVSEPWRQYFAGYQPDDAPPPSATAPVTAPPDAPAPEAPLDPGATPLTGIAARIAENMAQSLTVPTATSAREIPVKLLEENRRVINQHQATVAGPKVSFTHLIGWAIVRAMTQHPAMNAGFDQRDGKPFKVDRPEINLGLAIDVERRGERLLLVPNVKNAAALDFSQFVDAYDSLVARARSNKLTLDDFQDTTVTLTNPGMIGTSLSVPRLMAGQGVIVGVGSIGYPAEFSGMAPEVISELGISKIMTVTSTYDHRVIQGAESGAFLKTLERLMMGEDLFFEAIFQQISVPHEPILWSGDQNPRLFGVGGNVDAVTKQASVIQLIRAYRVRGHLYADLDPLSYAPQKHADLELSEYGLTVWDMDRSFITGGLSRSTELQTLREILDTLRETYCRHIGVEFMHIQDPDPRRWLFDEMEATRNADTLSLDEQTQILRKLNAAEAFETFLHTNYIGQKRFSLEGAETLIPMLDFLLNDACGDGVREVVIGMAHRGRLNVLANVVGKSADQIFREFEGDIDPATTHGSGDVKYHLGARGTFTSHDGARTLEVRVASNPSHLEAVNPVVEGMVRARQDLTGDSSRSAVLPVLIHGDAAFAGQGVVAETLNLSQLSGYRTGGTVHIVVNNQIGFTTRPADARSSMYPTDSAKMVYAPIFHVNGDHPDDAVRAIRRAFEYRQKFGRDVVVDLVCYRRWGHNEGDDPSYTHPILYAKIEQHQSVRKLFTEQMLRRGDIDPETAETAMEDYRDRLRGVHDEVRKAMAQRTEPAPAPAGRGEEHAPVAVETAVDAATLETVLRGLQRTPEGFVVHPKLQKLLDDRRERFESGKIDWALGEALAFGSLVLQGIPVRLSGEDSGRGTFSQRHAVLYDYRSAEAHMSLAHLDPQQAPFTVYDSLLSEFAVLGFEYGYSVDHPEALVLWEAQFGDFVNGAQVILDQFVSSAEAKWGQHSAITMLLPHGYEGQGPEHSSARLERFLQSCADGNIRVTNPSDPAQYFHLLRLQATIPDKKPLVVLTPKSLLRRRECVTDAAALTGGAFRQVIPDPQSADAESVKRIVLCSGKVYFDLAAHRKKLGVTEVLLHRVEQFYPFPAEACRRLLAEHASVRDVVWVQEEPQNMGAWSFLSQRLSACLAEGQQLRYVGRRRNPSPATGSQKRHLKEQAALLRLALEDPSPYERQDEPAPARTSS